MNTWAPRQITAAIRTLETSLGTAEVETDEGRAYFKPLDNPEGPHALASEWVGTRLAEWLGLETFDITHLRYDGAAGVRRKDGRPVDPGLGIVVRAERGFTLSDDRTLLAKIKDPRAITRLVVLDTWIRNRDRYLEGRGANYGNLFLSRDGASKGTYRLIAMDHTHAFADACELTPRSLDDRAIFDERIYGLFPDFVPLLDRSVLVDACARLRDVEDERARRFVAEVPPEWEIDRLTKVAWTAMITRRARFVAATILEKLEREHPSQLSANMSVD